MTGKRLPLLVRLHAKLDKSGGDNACWPFVGHRNAKGYGKLWKGQYAHRVALEEKLGRPLAPKMLALHDCDNPPCCNGKHLREGTNDDNMNDRVLRGTRKGRTPWNKGKKYSHGKAGHRA